MELNRTEKHSRSSELEQILKMLNKALLDDESAFVKQFDKPNFPPLFIVGNPRSGTTLFYQWLAASKNFAYPSNIVSRFYAAPYIGGLLHKIFIDHDKFNEFFPDTDRDTYRSVLGKTIGASSPHEFWYFWRQFFPFGDIQQLTDEQLAQVNTALFLKELAGLEQCFGKPLLLKAMILNWNLGFLRDIMPNAVFCFIKRNVVDNMHSIYRARKEFFGDVNQWYSFKPPEYPLLKEQDVYSQLAGQVIYTNRFIEKTLGAMPVENKLVVDYEAFCNNPKGVFQQLIERTGLKSANLHHHQYSGPEKFTVPRQFIEGFNSVLAEEAVERLAN